MKSLKCHPACLAFPRLSDEELQELADDIRERGLLHPIVLRDGKILDGSEGSHKPTNGPKFSCTWPWCAANHVAGSNVIGWQFKLDRLEEN